MKKHSEVVKKQSRNKLVFGGAVVVIIVAALVAVYFFGDDGYNEPDNIVTPARQTEPEETNDEEIIIEFEPPSDLELYAAKTILVQYRNFDTREEALEQAIHIYDMAVNNIDFDVLIRTFEGDGDYPEVYTFTRGGSMMDVFEEATAALEIGEIGLAESDFGIYIIQRVEP